MNNNYKVLPCASACVHRSGQPLPLLAGKARLPMNQGEDSSAVEIAWLSWVRGKECQLLNKYPHVSSVNLTEQWSMAIANG